MNGLKVRISYNYTDYLDIEVRCEEDVAETVAAVVTQIIASALSVESEPEVASKGAK